MDIEKEIEKVVNSLPQEPPQKATDTLLRNGALNGHALIYKAGYIKNPLNGFEKEPCCDIICTACGEHYKLDYVSSAAGCYCYGYSEIGFLDPLDKKPKRTEECCVCPECGAGAKALHVGRISGTFSIAYANFVTVHNVCGHLTLLKWQAQKQCNKQGDIFFRYYRVDGAFVINRKLYRVTSEQRYYNSYTYFSRWALRKKFIDGIDDVPNDRVFFDGDVNIIEQTDSAHCALEEYVKIKPKTHPIKYLKAWCKHPNIENLVRAKLGCFIESLIESCCYSTGNYYKYGATLDINALRKALNWKASKPHEIIGLEKEELSIARKGDYKSVKMYSICKKRHGIRLTASQIKTANIEHHDFLTLMQEGINGYFPRPVKLINYLNQQRPKKGMGITTLSYLIDYWNLLFTAEGAMASSMLYPKDLKAAHDDMVPRAKAKKNEIYNAGIVKYAKKYKKFAFIDETLGLFIRPCETHSELIEEGVKLNHCVATYAESISKGKTCIFFVRNINAPDVPFYTLEYKHGTIVQNRGIGNREETEDVKLFRKKWLEFIKNGGNKNGNRSNSIPKTVGA